MIRCLCCDKPLPDNATKEERKYQWHKRCIKKFFGTEEMPEIEISWQVLEQIAKESINKGYTVAGVQKKLSLHLSGGGKKEKPRLTLINYPMGYILKPQTEDYPCLPEAEFLTMQMANVAKIKTVPFALLKSGDNFAYITKRVDRTETGGKPDMLAMEDFCQLSNRLTENKYNGSYERCGKVIKAYSSRPGLDLSELFLRVVFSFAVGNSDMHLKNFSLIETAPGNGSYMLSPAYDLLPVNAILPADTEQFALTMNGKKRNLRRNDFLKFAAACGVDKKAAWKLIDAVTSQEEIFLKMVERSYMNEGLKTAMGALVRERMAALKPADDL